MSGATHRVWTCQSCGHQVWLPIGSLGHQADHDERPFCAECSDQGGRMTPSNERIAL